MATIFFTTDRQTPPGYVVVKKNQSDGGYMIKDTPEERDRVTKAHATEEADIEAQKLGFLNDAERQAKEKKR